MSREGTVKTLQYALAEQYGAAWTVTQGSRLESDEVTISLNILPRAVPGLMTSRTSPESYWRRFRDTIEAMLAEADPGRVGRERQDEALRAELAQVKAERDAYKDMVQAALKPLQAPPVNPLLQRWAALMQTYGPQEAFERAELEMRKGKTG